MARVCLRENPVEHHSVDYVESAWPPILLAVGCGLAKEVALSAYLLAIRYFLRTPGYTRVKELRRLECTDPFVS